MRVFFCYHNPRKTYKTKIKLKKVVKYTFIYEILPYICTNENN